MTHRQLFEKLFAAHTEAAVDQVIAEHAEIFASGNWSAMGGNPDYFAVIENQQASPIPALVEKVVNSVDAMLMRRCLEEGIDPKSAEAPRSIDEAVTRFFPNTKSWDLPAFRAEQAERIQILADGDRGQPSLTIYDDGEGQHPWDFENTFLSILRGNKREIHFVQGKYNMGGTGAIAFCGKKRYQLIASRRYDASGPFGFTLVRRHPLAEEERQTSRSSWYEFLKIGGEIPSFEIDEFDLRLYKRKFRTGTVIKLYSYDLPANSRSVISRDLNLSINEYLFQPALPLFTVDRKERYPKDQNLDRHLFGLRRRLEQEDNRYIEDYFPVQYSDTRIGELQITCYVFKPRIEGKNAQETKETVQREFFKNDMAVMFSINGQVHGHYTSEFISRTLKFHVLKDHLLIHVDCTGLDVEYRNELFMASRDRLKSGEESREVRALLGRLLRESKLKEIHKARRASISVESGDTQELLKAFTRRLPLQADLVKLLGRALQVEKPKQTQPKPKEGSPGGKGTDAPPPFIPKRFPSFLKLDIKAETKDGTPLVQVPLGGERTVRFLSDVEDHYFDRLDEPGELQLAILGSGTNNTNGGDKPGTPKAVSEVFNVVRASPDKGKIRVTLNPADGVQVGDAIRIRADLSAPGGSFEQIFWVKITAPEQKSAPPAKEPEPDPSVNLPALVLTYREPHEDAITWESVAEMVTFDHQKVVYPVVGEDDTLERVIVNMDSTVLLDYKARRSGATALQAADKRYIAGVYFHTLFLYMITRSRGYALTRKVGEEDKFVEVSEYLQDLFDSHYSRFLLDFETSDLVVAIEE